MAWADIAATTLSHPRVCLAPLAEEHRAGLHAIALDPDIWRYFVSLVDNDEDYEAYFDASLADHAAKRRVVFHITDLHTGRPAGSTSYGNLSEPDLRLEIGWSWLGREFRGQGVNRWVKYQLMEHAFETMGAERVEFKTDVLNVRARRGLRNIGATEEGVLRSFNPMPGGRRRDAIFYSVLRAEWPRVKEALASRPKVGAAG